MLRASIVVPEGSRTQRDLRAPSLQSGYCGENGRFFGSIANRSPPATYSPVCDSSCGGRPLPVDAAGDCTAAAIPAIAAIARIDVLVLMSFACLALALAGTVVFARRGDDVRSFSCAAIAMIVATPIVWLHSFVFLLAPVALLRTRLSPIWFVPTILWFFSSGTGNGEPWQTALTMAAAAFVAVAVLVPQRSWTRPLSRRARTAETLRLERT